MKEQEEEEKKNKNSEKSKQGKTKEEKKKRANEEKNEKENKKKRGKEGEKENEKRSKESLAVPKSMGKTQEPQGPELPETKGSTSEPHFCVPKSSNFNPSPHQSGNAFCTDNSAIKFCQHRHFGPSHFSVQMIGCTREVSVGAALRIPRVLRVKLKFSTF